MFKFSEESSAGLRKLGRDMYNVTHRNRPQPQAQTNQFQPNINNQQPTQTQTTQTTLPNTSGTPTVVNNIYNNIPPMNQTVTQSQNAKRFGILKAIFYAAILTIIILGVWYMITHGGIGHWLNQGIGKLHEILTAIF